MIDFEQAARSTSSTLSQDECGDTMHELRDMLSGSGQPQTQGCSKNPPAAPAAPPAQPDSKDSKESNDTNVTPMTNVTIIPDYYSLQCVESAMKATGLTAARVTYHDFSRFTESDGDSDGPPGMVPSDSDSDGPSEKLLKECMNSLAMGQVFDAVTVAATPKTTGAVLLETTTGAPTIAN